MTKTTPQQRLAALWYYLKNGVHAVLVCYGAVSFYMAVSGANDDRFAAAMDRAYNRGKAHGRFEFSKEVYEMQYNGELAACIKQEFEKRSQ